MLWTITCIADVFICVLAFAIICVLLNMCIYPNIFIDIVRLAHFSDIKQTLKAKKKKSTENEIFFAYTRQILRLLCWYTAVHRTVVKYEIREGDEEIKTKGTTKKNGTKIDTSNACFFFFFFYGCVRILVPGWYVLRILVS